jgi:hypothetical protein
MMLKEKGSEEMHEEMMNTAKEWKRGGSSTTAFQAPQPCRSLDKRCRWFICAFSREAIRNHIVKFN